MAINDRWRTLGRDAAPEAAGVYELGDRSGAVIYIGSSGNLQRRIAEHASAPANTCIGQWAAAFRYETTIAYEAREKQLFRQYKATHGGRIPPCNDRDPSA
ncbi:MAG TPA: GIY-YIG nuclease family protein [Dehalococcoidia bacterium]|nr:GIY-YIG nuclease family protein [Dehalococcoidia bacterium]